MDATSSSLLISSLTVGVLGALIALRLHAHPLRAPSTLYDVSYGLLAAVMLVSAWGLHDPAPNPELVELAAFLRGAALVFLLAYGGWRIRTIRG